MGASARQQAIAAEPGQRRHPRLPARRRGLPQDPARRHGVRRAALKGATFSPQRDASAQVRADGSTVDADVEAAAQARNGLEYETLVQVSKARVDIIEAAMGR